MINQSITLLYCDLAIDKFEFLSITSHSITVSWELGIPVINSTLILSVTDAHQTVNDEIDVTGYDSYTYSYTKAAYLCNVYTFKLTLPATTKGCNNDSKTLSTGTQLYTLIKNTYFCA